MADTKRGICPCCDREYALTAKGLMRYHWSPPEVRRTQGGSARRGSWDYDCLELAAVRDKFGPQPDPVTAHRLELVFGSKGAVFTHGHLTNTPSGAPYPLALAHDDWAALAAALRQPRCGDRMDSVLDNASPLFCDLSYGHPGNWHGADQYPPDGLPSRCEWTQGEAPK